MINFLHTYFCEQTKAGQASADRRCHTTHYFKSVCSYASLNKKEYEIAKKPNFLRNPDFLFKYLIPSKILYLQDIAKNKKVVTSDKGFTLPENPIYEYGTRDWLKHKYKLSADEIFLRITEI